MTDDLTTLSGPELADLLLAPLEADGTEYRDASTEVLRRLRSDDRVAMRNIERERDRLRASSLDLARTLQSIERALGVEDSDDEGAGFDAIKAMADDRDQLRSKVSELGRSLEYAAVKHLTTERDGLRAKVAEFERVPSRSHANMGDPQLCNSADCEHEWGCGDLRDAYRQRDELRAKCSEKRKALRTLNKQVFRMREEIDELRGNPTGIKGTRPAAPDFDPFAPIETLPAEVQRDIATERAHTTVERRHTVAVAPRKPPFVWQDSDRAKLVPGATVVTDYGGVLRSFSVSRVAMECVIDDKRKDALHLMYCDPESLIPPANVEPRKPQVGDMVVYVRNGERDHAYSGVVDRIRNNGDMRVKRLDNDEWNPGAMWHTHAKAVEIITPAPTGPCPRVGDRVRHADGWYGEVVNKEARPPYQCLVERIADRMWCRESEIAVIEHAPEEAANHG